MSLYSKFETSADREVDGVPFEFSEAGLKITIARAGGANKAFAKALSAVSARIRRALETSTLKDEDARKVLATAYADAVIKKWETLVDGEWCEGIENKIPGAPLLPATRINIVETLMALPTLLETIRTCAEDWQIYLKSNLEADAKN